jgi:hypothetical protein
MLGRLTAATVLIALTSTFSAVYAAQARAVVKDGTIKTADGQLLRGMSLHVSKTYSWAAVQWGLQKSNIQAVKDSLHLNAIRLNCLDPRAVVDGRPDQAFSTIAQEAVYTDSIVALAGEVGLYIMLNYHCLNYIYDNSTWDIRKFWDFYAPRYKDKTWVSYEIENEPYQDVPTGGASGWPTSNEVDLYKKVRGYAPNTVITGMVEPVVIHSDWSSYLKNVFAPAAGFSWNSGKDAWAFHPYMNSQLSYVLATRAGGIPLICTESAYPERNFPCPFTGYHLPAEAMEKNGISWMDWHSWQAADQLQHPAMYLIPDAVRDGWAWWTGTAAQSAPKPFATSQEMDFLSTASRMIQANGRVKAGRSSNKAQSYRLSILPDEIAGKAR